MHTNLPEGLLNFKNWLNYSLINVHIQYKCKAFSGIPVNSSYKALTFTVISLILIKQLRELSVPLSTVKTVVLRA